jgi:hypothetical protein
MDNTDIIDKYLACPYWIIDILPKQVPANGRGQYFRIENHLLQPAHKEVLSKKFFQILIKLNCYDDIEVLHTATGWTFNPPPQTLEEWIAESMLKNQMLYLLFKGSDSMITISGDDTYMTLYNASKEMLHLTCMIAQSVGMFVWAPQQG